MADNEAPKDSHDAAHNRNQLKLRRHYRTIGMGNVFLEPPPVETLPSAYLGHSPQQQPQSTHGSSSFLSREITGVVKSRPQDFIVREIALPGRYIPELSDQEIEDSRLAALGSGDDHDDTTIYCDNRTIPCTTLDDLVPMAKRRRLEQAKERHANGMIQHQQPAEAITPNTNIPESSHQSVSTESPMESAPSAMEAMSHKEIIESSIRDALHKQQSENNTITTTSSEILSTTDNVLQSIHAMEATIIETMRDRPHNLSQDASSNDISLGEIWIPPLASSTPRERGHFHRSMRAVFPLLATNSVPDSNGSSNSNKTNNGKSHKINIQPDPLFWGLIPFLHEPQTDLPFLYNLYKGPFDEDGLPPSDAVLLRLRPDLERTQRAPVHQLIAQKTRKALATDTVNVPLHEHQSSAGNDESPITTAIRVYWSRHSKRKHKKRGHNKTAKVPSLSASSSASSGENGSTSSSSIQQKKMNALFVVRKERLDHSAAVNLLTKAFRCPRADLSLAGKKDLFAVTYQHATLQNCTPERVAKVAEQLVRANSSIRLGKAVSVPWLLQKGDLAGNRFELALRQVKRVEVCVKDSFVTERMVPLDPQHLADCVQRVKTLGFINFFGEQRVGKAGDREIVGTRPSDIGKALLQQNWRDAVDLIIQGHVLTAERTKQHTEDECDRGRLSWIKDGRDPNVTSKLLKSLHYLSTERVLLNGLKRYPGDFRSALECLPEDERTFWISTYQSLVWNRAAAERIQLYGTKCAVKGDLILTPTLEEPTIVTGEDESVDIRSVVLPLPGTNVVYPSNDIGQFYKKLLKEDGVHFFKSKEQMRKGSYRHLIAPVSNLQYEFSSHEEILKLKFDLPSGSFATMMLRELMTTTVGRDGHC